MQKYSKVEGDTNKNTVFNFGYSKPSSILPINTPKTKLYITQVTIHWADFVENNHTICNCRQQMLTLQPENMYACNWFKLK